MRYCHPFALLLLALPVPVLAQPPPGEVHDTGVVEFEVFDFGKLGGYAGFPFCDLPPTCGTGFVFEGEWGLYEGALLVGASSDQVSGGVYDPERLEWATASPIGIAPPPPGIDQAFEAVYDDSDADDPVGLEITQRSYSRTGDPFVILEFTITNTSGTDLNGLHPGVFADWDVGEDLGYVHNLCDYDEDTKLLYCWEVEGINPNYYGVTALGPPGEEHTVTGVAYDALPGDASLYAALTTVQAPPVSPTDVRTVIGVGPFDLAAGEMQRAMFAFVGGASEAEVISNAAAAQGLVVGAAAPPAPAGGAAFHAPFPNPARGGTTLSFTLPRPQPVRLSVLDALGREVAVLVDGVRAAGSHALSWDASALPTGAYVVRLFTDGVGLTQRVAFVR